VTKGILHAQQKKVHVNYMCTCIAHKGIFQDGIHVFSMFFMIKAMCFLARLFAIEPYASKN
jgi:hypothetical protein